MRKRFTCWMLSLTVVIGCNGRTQSFDEAVRPANPQSISDQQLAAYPLLGENAYLVLADFESSVQLEDFATAAGGKSDMPAKIVYSGSPTATGLGAMAYQVDGTVEQPLTWSPLIRRWKGYNILLAAIYPARDGRGQIEIIDQTGKSDRQGFVFQKQIWNKITIDLSQSRRKLDLDRIEKVVFHFEPDGANRFILDDLILVDYKKDIAGDRGGPGGSLYVAEEGRQIRVGCNRRYELVFHQGQLSEWYDLTTDGDRVNNLLPSQPPINLLKISAGGTSEPLWADPAGLTTVTHADNCVEVKTEYASRDSSPRGAKPSIKYRIYADGLVLVAFDFNAPFDKIGATVGVDPNQGFDAVVGRIKNPSPGAGDNRIEYVLFRRMGKRAGADLLVAVKPIKSPAAAVQCRVQPLIGNKALNALFSVDSYPGQTTLQMMLRVWPTDIDNLANAENLIRKFLESNWPDLKTPGSGETWNPEWDMK